MDLSNKDIVDMSNNDIVDMSDNKQPIKYYRDLLISKFGADNKDIQKLGFLWSDVDKIHKNSVSIDEFIKN